MTYAFTVKTDPSSGEPLFSGNSRVESTSPQVERALFILRTPRGSCLLDPDIGVEWSRVNKLATGAAETAKAAITDGLRALTSDNSILNLTVACEVSVARGLLLYDVAFTDPRLDRRARIQGSF